MKNEVSLYNRIRENADSFEAAFEQGFEGDDADAPLISPARKSSGTGSLGQSKEKPIFSAQFDMSIIVQYFDVTVATGVHAAIAPAGLLAAAKTDIGCFLFGQSDFLTGFKFGKQNLTVTNWVWSRTYIYGFDEPDVIFDPGSGANVGFPAQIKAVLQPGDLVTELYYDSGGATDNKCCIIHRCSNVAYGTLLNSLGSDRFIIDQIRYSIPDATKIAQYGNNLVLLRQSLFGKNQKDTVSPNAFKSPNNFQTNIIDIPIKKGIDKESMIVSYLDYDVGQIDLSIYVWKVRKVTA